MFAVGLRPFLISPFQPLFASVGKDLMFAVGLRRGGVLDWKEDETVGVGKDLMFAVGLRR